MKNQLSKLLGKTAWALEAPLFFLFLVDIRRNKIITEHKGYEYKNNSIDYFMNSVIDASLAMQNLINSAEEFGLGICPISMVRNHLEEVKKMCHLPDGVFPIAGLSAGWPDENNEVSIRLPMKVVFHEDFYKDKDIINQIDDYDKTIQSFQPIPKSKQRHVNVYGFNKKNTWSENISRQMSLPERKEFKKWLKSSSILITNNSGMADLIRCSRSSYGRKKIYKPSISANGRFSEFQGKVLNHYLQALLNDLY